MFKKFLLILGVLLFGLTIEMQAAEIILVTEYADTNLHSIYDDQELIDWLVNEGHRVDVRRNYWTTLDSDKIAELNSADLIIVSRLTDSAFYSDGVSTTQWNSVTTPLIQMNAFFARNTRWKWVDTSTAISDNPDIYAEAADPNHPIFRGVSLTRLDSDDPADPVNIVQIVDPLIGTGFTSFIGTDDMGNGRLIAKPLGLDMGWIAEWDAGVEFYEGSGEFAGGKRMLFCTGTDRFGGTHKSELNLTPDGLQMLRNAIAYMLGGADIILVTQDIDWNLDGLRDDHALETFLVSEGHFVDVRPDHWTDLNPDKIAELNSADLVIFSRLTWSDKYSEGYEATEWNSLEVPILQMNAYFARNFRWNWVNSDWATNDTSYIYAEAVDPYHPVFQGMSFAAQNLTDSDYASNIIQIIEPRVGSGITTFIDTTDMGNGRLIARPLEAGMGWIAEWNAGVEFYRGAGQYAGGKRMLFCAGTQEISYFDDYTQEIITTAQGELNLTDAGLQMFHNAIDYLLLPEPD